MLKKIITLQFILLTAAAQSIGQTENFVVVLEPEVIFFPNREFYIDSVIDARPFRDNIGKAQVGMGNRQVAAQFSQSVELTLKKYFSETTPERDGQSPIVAVITKLNVSEKTYAMKERGIAELEITFCKVDSGKLKVITTVQDRQESGGADVTKGHGKRFVAALRTCLLNFNSSDWKLKSSIKDFAVSGPAAPLSEFKAVDNEHDILKCTVKNEGLYNTFLQLRSNTPTPGAIMLKPRGILYVLRDSLTTNKLGDPFGLCENNVIYINTIFYNQANSGKGVFAKVVEEGRYFAWIDHYVGTGEAVTTQLAFGLVGRMVANSGIDLIVMDMKTSIIKPIKSKDLEIILKDDPNLLSKYIKAPNKQDINIMLAFLKSYNKAHPL